MNAKTITTWLFRPFEKIAGWKALAWGMGGMAVSIWLSYLAGYHYHGLLHYGPAPNDAWWVYGVEHLLIWFWTVIFVEACGMILSRAKHRRVDTFGMVAFAQLPLLGANLFAFTPPMQRIMSLDLGNLSIENLIDQPHFMGDMFWAMLIVVFPVWMLIWLFNAMKVSFHLKGGRLWIGYILSILLSDLVSRAIIGSLY